MKEDARTEQPTFLAMNWMIWLKHESSVPHALFISLLRFWCLLRAVSCAFMPRASEIKLHMHRNDMQENVSSRSLSFSLAPAIRERIILGLPVRDQRVCKTKHVFSYVTLRHVWYIYIMYLSAYGAAIWLIYNIQHRIILNVWNGRDDGSNGSLSWRLEVCR